jgi:hypothetical protein
MKDDPVVQRVRDARHKIAQKAGHDRSKLFQWAKQIESQHAERVVGYQPAHKPKAKR